MKTWVPVNEKSNFSIFNIPFGIFSTATLTPRVGIAIGELVLDLVVVNNIGLFDQIAINSEVLNNGRLNDFINLGKGKTSLVREIIQRELCDENSILKENALAFLTQTEVTMHLPIEIGDYTDFYSSIEHATNVGKMFRNPENALLPNWKHLPVGYHGRASSIIISGEAVHRPKGQVLPPNNDTPIFQPSKRLDFELEMAFIIGKNSKLGKPISIHEAKNYIFGKVLFNDWSARDIQKWEYVPLGPFLGKSFASSISPWVVTMEALEPFKAKGPEQDPPVLPYLKQDGLNNYDIELEVYIQPENGRESIVSTSNFKYMYWSMFQQLTHHTSNGCNVKIGDIMASGTISGKNTNAYGSMLELSWGGKNEVNLLDGVKRKFIEDNDTVIMKGYCENNGKRVGFGEVRTKLLPTT